MKKLRFVLIGLLGPLLALAPLPALAYSLDARWTSICSIVGCRPVIGSVGLSLYVADIIIPGLQLLFVGLLVVMLFVYGAQLVFRSNEESSIAESKLAYTYAITGAAIVSFANWLTRAFSPVNHPSAIVEYSFIKPGFGKVYMFMKLLLGAAFTANLVLQAFRLITAQGSDELIGRARKRFLASFVGVAIVLLANTIITAVNPELSGNAGLIADEIIGVANFLLTLLAIAAIGAIIVAGILLVVSVDEQLKERAKQIARTTVISLAVILASFVLVNTFLTAPVS